MREAEYRATEIHAVGASLSELRIAGFSAGDIKSLRFTNNKASDARAAGFS